MPDEKHGRLSKPVQQFLNYVAVGGAAFAIDFGTLYFLTEYARLHYLASATVGFLAGLFFNYLLCISIVFDFRAIKQPSHEFGVFAIIGLAGLLLNDALIWLLTEYADRHYLLSKLLSATVVLVFNFALRRQLLFSDNCYARHLLGRNIPSSR
jgi:putative flippase GtrA